MSSVVMPLGYDKHDKHCSVIFASVNNVMFLPRLVSLSAG